MSSSNGHHNGNGFHLSSRGKHARGDAKLVAQAIRQRWPVTPEMRESIASDALDLSKNAQDERVRARCMDIILKMEGQNQSDQHFEVNMAAKGARPDGMTVRVEYVEAPAIESDVDD